jgi:hypothetical protein
MFWGTVPVSAAVEKNAAKKAVPFLADEDALKQWVENTVRDAPPAGGSVTMLKHWPPKYADNDRVGKIWVVPALVDVDMGGGNKGHELAFLVYHMETKKAEMQVAMPISSEDLPKYLGGKSAGTGADIAPPSSPLASAGRGSKSLRLEAV